MAKEPDFTVCKQCINLIRENDSDSWHSNFCKAVPLPKARDPYDGEIKRYYGQNIFTEDKYKNCKKINDGKCPHFEKKLRG
jgi:hypothetical protein